MSVGSNDSRQRLRFPTTTLPHADAEMIGGMIAAVSRIESKVSDLDKLKASVEELTAAEARREGAARVWRGAGSLVGAIALALGGAALSLAFTASADHDRVAEHDAAIAQMQRDLAARELQERERWERMQGALHEAEVTISVTREVLVRVERQLEALEQRRTPQRPR